MRKFILSVLLLIVIAGYLVVHDRRQDFAPISGSCLMSFAERIDGDKKIGICDSNYVVLREAKYSYVDGQGGFVIGYDTEKEDIDIILADGDSVLCGVEGKRSVFDTACSIPHLLVTDRDQLEYIVLQNGQVIGPGKNLSICQRQKVVVTCNGCWGIFSFENKPILPAVYQKVVFVNRDSDEEGEMSEEKTEYLLALHDRKWHKFSPEGLPLDTVSAAFADTLLQSPACEMQTGNAVFSVRL